MELSLLLFQKILSMALMMLMGYAVVKTGVLSTAQARVLSLLCMYVIVPCTLINSFLMPYETELLKKLGIAFMGALGGQLLFMALARLFRRPLRLSSAEQACLIYTNCGNLLIPIVNSLLGQEYVFYLNSFLAVNTVFAWIQLPSLLSGAKRHELGKIITNPNVIAIAAGLIVFVLDINVPAILKDTLSSVAASVGPVSMMLTGMLMAGINLKASFSSRRNWLVSCMRLFVLPFIYIAIIAVLGITRASAGVREVLLISTMGAAAPVASVVVQMTNVFGGDYDAATTMNAVTTIMCIFTMPVMILVYQVLC